MIQLIWSKIVDRTARHLIAQVSATDPIDLTLAEVPAYLYIHYRLRNIVPDPPHALADAVWSFDDANGNPGLVAARTVPS